LLQTPSLWFDKGIAEQYEGGFAAWNGTRHAFSFMSGREALSACIFALGLEPGDEVIVPGYTCVVVPNAFAYAGIGIVYADIELDTYGLDATSLERRITAKTRAVVLQHLYGLLCRDYAKIVDFARSHGLLVIEDCAHAAGVLYGDVKVGNLGDVAFFSSEQSKSYCTIRGGLAVTNSDEYERRLRDYQNAASFPSGPVIEAQLKNIILNYYQNKHKARWILGDLAELIYGESRIVSTTKEEESAIRPLRYGQRMAGAIAKLGLNQLKKLDSYNAQRRAAAVRWDAWCEENKIRKPLVANGSTPSFLRYPVLVPPEKKRDLAWARRELGIVPGVWFTTQTHPAHREVTGCPNGETAVQQCINFPTLLS